MGKRLVTGVLADAEHTARQAHPDTDRRLGPQRHAGAAAAGLDIPVQQAQRPIDGEMHTAFAACRESCPNALVTATHVPRLKGDNSATGRGKAPPNGVQSLVRHGRRRAAEVGILVGNGAGWPARCRDPLGFG